MIEVISNSTDDTQRLGSNFAKILRPGDTVALYGELGSGKTVFVRGAVAGLGYNGRVTSPTFTLIHEYPTGVPVHHLDCFRLRKPQDVLTLGIEEYLEGESILFVEWADIIKGYFNQWFWTIHFYFVDNDDNKRRIQFDLSAGTTASDRFAELQDMISRIPEVSA